MPLKSFESFLNELVDKTGQGTLADKIGIDGAMLSRFRSGQGSLNIQTIEKILHVGDGAIVGRGELRRLEDALEVLSDLWKKARKGEGNGKTRSSDKDDH